MANSMNEGEEGRNARPPYSYVPGGPWPHPIREPGGHSFGHRPGAAPPIGPGGWRALESFVRGADLFNDGFYWEAHEAWEPLWHAHGRSGPEADLIKGLIKLAAAGVKVREGQPRGVATHAGRAAALFESTRREVGPRSFGLDLDKLARAARGVEARPPVATFGRDAAVAVVFDFRIEPA